MVFSFTKFILSSIYYVHDEGIYPPCRLKIFELLKGITLYVFYSIHTFTLMFSLDFRELTNVLAWIMLQKSKIKIKHTEYSYI